MNEQEQNRARTRPAVLYESIKTLQVTYIRTQLHLRPETEADERKDNRKLPLEFIFSFIKNRFFKLPHAQIDERS